MASSHSVTRWIEQLRAGDQVAAQHLWKGYTTEEIAAKLRRVPRTVERTLDLIRQRWTA
jgi:ECF sigma factor